MICPCRSRVHPKLSGSKVHAAYGRYKTATTVGEARALDTSRSMVNYAVDKGHAVVHDQPAVVVLALAATFAPLAKAWCAEDCELGKVGELRGRRVIRYTLSDRQASLEYVKTFGRLGKATIAEVGPSPSSGLSTSRSGRRRL